jgi:hypothetical protein
MNRGVFGSGVFGNGHVSPRLERRGSPVLNVVRRLYWRLTCIEGGSREGKLGLSKRRAVFPMLFALAAPPMSAQVLSIGRLELHNVKADAVTYRGKASVRVTDASLSEGDDISRIAIVRGLAFEDGVIEVALTGDTAPDAPATLRGFVGIAFRVAGTATQYECIYIRPKNGRSEDQLQRNHSTQYISVPGFPWQKLRGEQPGVYESYADLAPGVWTQVKIEVSATKASLYLNSAPQPALLVNDLKQKAAPGAVALWLGPGTIAHFADLKVSPARAPGNQ